MLAVLCGLVDERRIVARSGALVLCGTAAAAGLERSIPSDCAGIMSFGICGALAPTLRVGDLVLGTSVMDGTVVYPADARWTDRLSATLAKLHAKRGPVWSGGVEAAHTPDERAVLFAATKCWTIDDESNAVAQIARSRAVPFSVLRAVSDDARTTLPPAARRATHPDGRLNLDAVFAALRANPSQILALEKTVFDFGYAIGRLRDAYRSVGPNFCFP